MTHSIPFDTLAFVKELQSAGVPQAQAEVQAKTMAAVLLKVEETYAEELATKGDLQVEAEKIRREIAATKSETIKWMAAMFAGQTALILGALFGLLRFSPPPMPTMMLPHQPPSPTTPQMNAPAAAPLIR